MSMRHPVADGAAGTTEGTEGSANHRGGSGRRERGAAPSPFLAQRWIAGIQRFDTRQIPGEFRGV